MKLLGDLMRRGDPDARTVRAYIPDGAIEDEHEIAKGELCCLRDSAARRGAPVLFIQHWGGCVDHDGIFTFKT